MAKHIIELDDDEVANLKAAIEAAGYPHSKNIPKNPLEVLDNGPWLGNIYNKLPDTTSLPAMKPLQLATVARQMTRSETCQFTHLHYTQAMLRAKDLILEMKSNFIIPISKIDAVVNQLNEALGENPVRSWEIFATMQAVPAPKAWDQPFETIEGDEIWYVRRKK